MNSLDLFFSDRLPGSEEFDVQDEVGHGTFSEVHRAKHKSTGELVALKHMHLQQRDTLPVHVQREIHALRTVHPHPNIVTLLDVHQEGFGVCLVMQLCLTNLHTLLERSARPLDAALAKAVMQQLLQALQAVHECGLVHRDVATTNVLFDGAGGVRLADFGLARQALPASDQGPGASGPVCMSPRVGTRWYVAPEVLFGSRHYGAAVDLWGAGCIMAELLTGQPLFPGSSDIQQACRMMRVLGSIDEEAWPGVKALPDWGKLIFPPHTAQPWESIAPGASPAALRLLQGLLQYNPEHRMGAAEALQAEYFTSEQPRAAGAAEVKAAVCALLAAPMSAGNQPADGNEPPAAMLL